MQRRVRVHEGAAYDPDDYLRPESVAQAILTSITATPDAHITDLTIRPHG